MKFIRIITITLAVSCSLNLFGQITVETNGEVEIGNTINDILYINPNSDEYEGTFVIEGGYMLNNAIRPSINNKGYLGTSSKQFYFAYMKYGQVDMDWITSDERKKKNIKEIDNSWALKTLAQFKPKKYDMIEDFSKYDEKQKKVVEKLSKDNYGFLAQDVEKFLPEIVFTEEDSLGSKSINYNALIPILVSAIQAQQKEIDNLKALLKKGEL